MRLPPTLYLQKARMSTKDFQKRQAPQEKILRSRQKFRTMRK
nr:MAG TPA: hypothetical protein [Caudoviricetes sp.]